MSRMVSPGKIRHHIAKLLLLAVVTLPFLPLLAGSNFLQFNRLPSYCRGFFRTMGQQEVLDWRYVKVVQKARWMVELEASWFTINLPQDFYTSKELRKGRLPLWDPYTGAGSPTIDSGQFRPFNPFKLPFFIIPTFWTFCICMVALLLTGAFGMFLWLKHQALSETAQFMGAAVFALNPWVMERLALSDASAYFLLPWCLLGISQLERLTVKGAALAAIPFALMAHVGHPVTCGVITLAITLWWIISQFSKDRAVEPTFRDKSVRFLLMAVLAILATAVLWLPAIRLFFTGQSYKRFTSVFYTYHQDWRALFTPGSDMFLLPVFIALAVGALAIERRSRFWGAACAISLFLIMPLPLIESSLALFFQRFLGFHVLYLNPLFWASTAIMCSFGIDALKNRLHKLNALALGCGVLWMFVILLSVPFLGLSLSDATAHPILLLALSAAGLAGLGIILHKKMGLLELISVPIIVIPLVFPLSLNNLCWNNFHLDFNEAAEWVKRESPSARVISMHVIPPNWGQAFETRCGEQNSVLFPNRYLELFLVSGRQPTLVAFDRIEELMFRQMGISVILAEPAAIEDPVTYNGRSFSSAVIPDSYGRLFFAEKAETMRESAALIKQIMELSHGSEGGVVAEGLLGAVAPANWPSSPKGVGKAAFIADGVHEIEVQTSNQVDGLLVLKDSWYPGWNARVDGLKVPIYRINGCFRGVIVPAGDHKVQFEYKPVLVYTALVITLLAALAIVYFAFFGRC